MKTKNLIPVSPEERAVLVAEGGGGQRTEHPEASAS